MAVLSAARDLYSRTELAVGQNPVLVNVNKVLTRVVLGSLPLPSLPPSPHDYLFCKKVQDLRLAAKPKIFEDRGMQDLSADAICFPYDH